MPSSIQGETAESEVSQTVAAGNQVSCFVVPSTHCCLDTPHSFHHLHSPCMKVFVTIRNGCLEEYVNSSLSPQGQAVMNFTLVYSTPNLNIVTHFHRSRFVSYLPPRRGHVSLSTILPHPQTRRSPCTKPRTRFKKSLISLSASPQTDSIFDTKVENMVSTTTIQALPTEIFSLITAQLPMRDFCNLRLTNRHIDHETHVDFACRGYEEKRLSFRTNDIRRFVDTVQNPVIAASIKTLKLSDLAFVAPSQPSARNLQKGTPQRQQSAHVVLEEVDFMEVMAKMPNLQTVELDGLRSQSLDALLFPYGKGKGYARAVGPSVTSLRVSTSALQSEELCSLLEALGTKLRKLTLCRMVSRDGKWSEVLRTVEAMRLRELRLDDLQSSDAMDIRGRHVTLEMLGGDGRRVNRGIRGAEGIEQYWIQRWMAGMAGESAVEAGLALIRGRIGAR